MALLHMTTSEPAEQLIALLLGYFLGAIPFAWIIARMKGVNLFEVGSGSSGATNAARALGWRWFFPIFALDVLKGFGPVFVAVKMSVGAPGYSIDPAIFAMIGAILGHTFSIFLKFRGGKAVATGVGTVLALSPATGGAVLGVFALVFLLTRYVSLGSILAALCVPAAYWYFEAGNPYEMARFLMLCFVSFFVVWKHRGNLKRLLAGTESKAIKRPPAAANPGS